ncbi:hypothetical protein DSO57_1019596 [Entomophthora muscae]|uniref:Uncharacterized protein n=1 Tax=Entomophthora muscae TaxID=34485 RepID=A0ACC2T444_9FUNG|nr:hypothetical protein DSO57_1019596 [Entomophthora muscae]
MGLIPEIETTVPHPEKELVQSIVPKEMEDPETTLQSVQGAKSIRILAHGEVALPKAGTLLGTPGGTSEKRLIMGISIQTREELEGKKLICLKLKCRKRREEPHEPEPEFPSRYLYNQESGLWFDQETGTYSYYDETLGGYVPWEETSHGDASMRLVIIESEVLEPQKLVIVDSDGLTVGRDRGTDKRLRLAEMYTSKFHANIYLQTLPMDNLEFINSERLDESLAYIFCIVDCGSQHGTFVNETRLSESKVASQPFILKHLDLIKIGTTTMQVHQHSSGLVCDSCGTTETNVVDLAPVQPAPVEPQPITLKGASKREALEAARKQELRRLKRQYGGSKGGQSEYTDRAALRRQTQPDSPPPSASAAAEIYAPSNHGERLLMKHGWERGQGLGSQGQGIVEPIALQGSDNRMGLGYGQSSAPNAMPAQQETLQQATRRIYRQRFQDL